MVRQIAHNSELNAQTRIITLGTRLIITLCNHMNKEELEQHIATYRGSEGSYPFGPEALVFKVMGKMFALVSQGEDIPRITVKCDPSDGAMLVGQYSSVVPGYYMNKKHWITISLTGELDEARIKKLLHESYDLVVCKLTKKDKAMLKEL